MAANLKLLTFLNPTSTGAQAYTGAGFQPSGVLFLGAGQNVDTAGAHASFALGFGVSSTNRFAYQAVSRDNNGSFEKYSQHKNDHVIAMRNVAGGSFVDADLDSLDADGFTLDWTTANAAQRDFGALCIGGDIDNFKVLEFTDKTSTGTLAVTGAGFQPSAVIIVNTGITTAANATQDDDQSYSIGFTDGTRDRCVGGASEVNIGGHEYSVHGNNLINLVDFDGTALKVADLDSLDADGFTLDYTTADANAYRCYAICIEGGSVHVESETTPTSTGTKATTGAGFQPRGVLAASVQLTAVGSAQDRYLSLGMASGTGGTEHYNIWNGSEDDPVSSSVADRVTESDMVLTVADEGTPTINESLEVDSYDADGITFDAIAAQATEHLFSILLFGDDPVDPDLFNQTEESYPRFDPPEVVAY